jgi:hypothetical protein
VTLDFESEDFANQFDTHYGLLAPQQTVLVRPYSDDADDRMLAEIQPNFIVMFEPNKEFIRRIEVSYWVDAMCDNDADQRMGRCTRVRTQGLQ